MKKIIIVILVVFTATIGAAFAQRISGNLTPLKGQEVNLILDFSGLTVNGKSEESYMENEVKNKNEKDKKEWLEEWNVKLRKEAFNNFVKGFNKEVEKHFRVGAFPKATYTINVKIKDISPGFYAGIMNKPAQLKVEITFLKAGESTPITTVVYKKATSVFNDEIPITITRIENAFQGLGGFFLGRAVNYNLTH
jgi:hypothetical protein